MNRGCVDLATSLMGWDSIYVAILYLNLKVFTWLWKVGIWIVWRIFETGKLLVLFWRVSCCFAEWNRMPSLLIPCFHLCIGWPWSPSGPSLPSAASSSLARSSSQVVLSWFLVSCTERERGRGRNGWGSAGQSPVFLSDGSLVCWRSLVWHAES